MIPFNVPYVPDASKNYVLEALKSSHQQGDGPFTTKASKMVSDLVGGGHVLLTPSCTHALEMASMLANLGPGDEVILPSYTFTSAATAISKFGATPVFVDIEADSKGIDVKQVRGAITNKTRAISWVNYAGVAPDIEGLQGLAKEFGLLLIEDNAHGLGASYKGKPLGSFGDFATQSFHATKNVQCGEGGALVINNSNFIERAEVIREKGTNRSLYVRGEVQKYQWVDQGSSYLIAESLAALLLGQLENFEYIQNERKIIFHHYSSFINSYVAEVPQADAINASHMFYFQFDRQNLSERFIAMSKDRGVAASSHYQPLHNSSFGQQFQNSLGPENKSEFVSRTIVRLPLWLGLTKGNLDKVLSVSEEIMIALEKGNLR